MNRWGILSFLVVAIGIPASYGLYRIAHPYTPSTNAAMTAAADLPAATPGDQTQTFDTSSSTTSTSTPSISQQSAAHTSAPQQSQPASPPTRVVTVQAAPAQNLANYVTQNELDAGLSALSTQISSSTNAERQQLASQQAITAAAFAPSQRINQLSNATLNNVSVNGLSGLTASDIPNLSGSYLPVGGGTLSGTLSVTSTGTSTFSGPVSAGDAIEITNPNSAANLYLNGVPIATASSTGWDTFFGVHAGDKSTAAPTGWSDNTGFGYQALESTVPGSAAGTENTAVGAIALQQNVNGYNNTAVGFQALQADGSNDNTSVGNASLAQTTTGMNTAVGSVAGYNNVSGIALTLIGTYTDVLSQGLSNATAIGWSAKVGKSNSLILGATGGSAVDVGIGTTSPWALLSVEAADNVSAPQLVVGSSTATSLFVGANGNVGVGTTSPISALAVTGTSSASIFNASDASNIIQLDGAPMLSWHSSSLGLGPSANTGSGSYNTAVGNDALGAGGTGDIATAIGDRALGSLTSGTWNVAVGAGTLSAVTSSDNNTAVGTNALEANFTGTDNSVLGQGNLRYFVYGSLNTAVGAATGYNLSSGSYDTFIGAGAGNIANATSSIAVGYNAAVTADNQIVLGTGITAPTISGALDIGNLIYGTGVTGTGTTVSSGGDIAIGTTTPYARLTIWGPDSAASTTAFAVVNSASTTDFAVYDNGNATYAGSIFQSSDQRLKTNVTSLEGTSALSRVEQLNPVSYDRIDQPDTGENLGFIAQQVQQVFPELVSTTSATSLTPDGTLTLNYVGLISPIVSAVQEIAHISGDFKTNLIAWLGNSANGIENLFATNIFASNVTASNGSFSNQLCVGGVCVTATQFQQMAAAAGIIPAAASSQSSTTSVTTSTTTATTATSTATTTPQLSVNGNNPAQVSVGATYNDLGATITGPTADLHLGIQVSVDGQATTTEDKISIDTSHAGTHTIIYGVQDQSGQWGFAEREVDVSAPDSLFVSTSTNSTAAATTSDATSTAP